MEEAHVKCSKDTEEGVINSSRLGKGKDQERPTRSVDSYIRLKA